MSGSSKPFAQSCEENKDAILKVIAPLFSSVKTVLEIGSGTGQHAVYFAQALPQLTWRTSDCIQNHPGIKAWIDDEAPDNVLPPFVLDVTGSWPDGRYDAIFSANTAHIMSLVEVEAMIRGLPRVMNTGSLFVLYGPFNYGGRYTSESNARFDQWLAAQHPDGGIKDFDDLNRLAESVGLGLCDDVDMPANNRTLIWKYCASET